MDQETAIELLRERYAHGGVPLEEYRRLMGKLLVTTDPAECQALLDELPPVPADIAEARASDEPARPRGVSQHVAGSERRSAGSPSSGPAHRILAMFGEVNRSDDLWDLGPETHVTALFGEVKLDVRMARLVEGENILRVQAIFGEVRLTIPEGMDVTIHTSVQFGEVSSPRYFQGSDDHRRDVPPQQGGRRLTIYATATFGQVTIRTI
jgi:cell wall-active antibiotic response 4TMS protein YvqF